MIKCCIFDLDGTLLYTLETIRFYLNKALEKYSLTPITREECQSFVGNGVRSLIRSALDSRGINSPEIFERVLSDYSKAYDNEPYHLTQKYRGIDYLLSELKNSGIKLAVLSNKPDFATKRTIERFFPDTFDLVFGGRENVALKPSPDGCFEILSELGFSANECAYIGDSDVDVITGKNMNAAVNISVSWGYRTSEELVSVGATNIVSTAEEILKTIQKTI